MYVAGMHLPPVASVSDLLILALIALTIGLVVVAVVRFSWRARELESTAEKAPGHGPWVYRYRYILIGVGIALVLSWNNGTLEKVLNRGDDKSAEACGILTSGNELCGADLKAYCEQFAYDAMDQGTVMACAGVGARSALDDQPVTDTTALAAQCVKLAKYPDGCDRLVEVLDTAGQSSIPPYMDECVRKDRKVHWCAEDLEVDQ